MPGLRSLVIPVAAALLAQVPAAGAQQASRLLWGDTHLHTSYSFDAFLNQNDSADPDTAYRWARGLPVIHPYTEARVQIGTPLDFLVVSDHAEGMGVLRAVVNHSEQLGEVSGWGQLKRWFAIASIRLAMWSGNGPVVFKDLLPLKLEHWGDNPVLDPGNPPVNDMLGDITPTVATTWQSTIAAAEANNRPGEFTALLGWEWSSIPAGANLHRVIVTPNGGEQAGQYLPYGSDQSQYPQDLWQWLQATAEATGSQFISIPHNSNISKGYMFAETTLRGEPMTPDYIATRRYWEPVVEMTQLKGDSETHPSLSPDDPFADFEPFEFYLQQDWQPYRAAVGDFIRPALGRGLQLAERLGSNPYQFGLIGSTDAHTGLSSAEEDNFWGKMAYDSIPANKTGDAVGDVRATGWDMSAAGMAAVWASDNTRQGIFDAMRRREVYATTGPRVAVRMFAGWGFVPEDAASAELAAIGYAGGVPMGGELAGPPAGDGPRILVSASKDPVGANLDRIQVIKGWVDGAGQSREKIYNVAWSGERELAADGSLPAVGDTVDPASASYSNSIGAAQLATVWTDPEFDPAQSAFYYVRVLQIPTPRHSQYDAVALGLDRAGDFPVAIQERAYTSPVWYSP
ncbi:MAG: DUF3604 domain-containing protein [Pseudomonadales bacterium]|nr:DUF3604 domain-containing protein [Pseudomonadales bacterium]MCP5190044.1 DUF3604 domain-containing protein [Pseudomonadales bacterium]